MSIFIFLFFWRQRSYESLHFSFIFIQFEILKLIFPVARENVSSANPGSKKFQPLLKIMLFIWSSYCNFYVHLPIHIWVHTFMCLENVITQNITKKCELQVVWTQLYMINVYIEWNPKTSNYESSFSQLYTILINYSFDFEIFI